MYINDKTIKKKFYYLVWSLSSVKIKKWQELGKLLSSTEMFSNFNLLAVIVTNNLKQMTILTAYQRFHF